MAVRGFQRYFSGFVTKLLKNGLVATIIFGGCVSNTGIDEAKQSRVLVESMAEINSKLGVFAELTPRIDFQDCYSFQTGKKIGTKAQSYWSSTMDQKLGDRALDNLIEYFNPSLHRDDEIDIGGKAGRLVGFEFVRDEIRFNLRLVLDNEGLLSYDIFVLCD